ncbi:MAG: redoxin domain-containing protein [Candidatus Lokiarchaeota archaeon]|nr:redoxin domain-containing protein [Candidatus Lokiarchaeota archaeon]MBD3340757.1 redoxin domain-containing protein [Candidatus Lokiarchaeota archaeon]
MAENKIKEGDKAPLFKLDSFNSGNVDLAEEIKGRKVVLIFSRYFGCPICQLDLKTLINRKEEIREKDAKIIYVTQSGEKVAKEFEEREGIDFPVIPSTKDELYKEYGLGMMTPDAIKQVRQRLKEATKAGIEHGEYEGWEQQGPGQFVINTEGTVIHAQEGWLDVDSILKAL